jgi:predicted nuclease of predicted toxin-antitoxin system
LIARVKLDEDLPRQVADLLAARGHDTATVMEQGWQGTPDNILWSFIQSERRWLITADKGFADLRRYPPGSHCGVILLRIPEESRRAYIELAALMLDRIDLDGLGGAVVVATGCSVRIRRP